jgi:RNA polymerase sigma-54 factor
MQLTASLNLKQKQSLVMTPQLQQAIRLLQMTNLDLRQYLETECFENPFLEVGSAEETNEVSKTELDQQPESEIKSKSDLNEIDNVLTNGEAQTDDPTSNQDYENRFDTETTDFTPKNSTSMPSDDYDFIASSVENNPISLQEHVYKEIDLSFTDTNSRLVAHAFAESLEPSGWINLDSPEVAAKCGTTVDFCDSVLTKLQSFEPAGLFARNLKECLIIQAREGSILTKDLTILLNNLELLAKGQFESLQRKIKCGKEALIELIKIIRSFNPKPGETFELGQNHINAPDLMVKKARNGWVVDLNKSNLPSVFVNTDYADELSKKVRDAETHEYAAQAIASARWLKRAVAKRNSTTLKVGSEIIRRQTDFLEKGLDYLKPLSLKDIAEKVNMHESTISRVTSGLLINTPRGTFPLKSFFSISIDTDRPGIETSAAAVRNLIKTIISQENSKKPFSYEALAEIISDKGVKLARRTVAKYRELMRIPSSSERRRRARVFGN